MTPAHVRPFRRSDRDQLTALVNAHVAAVVPGASVPVQVVLAQLEGEPGEFIVDPWVRERRTLVAEQRGRLVAAAHLLRYGGGSDVAPTYRDAAEIRWLVFWPPAPFWPDADVAAAALRRACLAQLDAWSPRVAYADGCLPGPGVYGVPEQWPHVREAYAAAGFHGGRSEEVLVLTLDAPLPTSRTDLAVSRTLGSSGTRFTALREGAALGYAEVDTNLAEPGRSGRGVGWADVGNLWVEPEHRRQGVAAWLLAQAADWLRLGGFTRLLTYLGQDDDPAEAAFVAAVGFRPLTRTVRGLVR